MTTKKQPFKPPVPAPPGVLIYERGDGVRVKDPEAWQRRSWLRRVFTK